MIDPKKPTQTSNKSKEEQPVVVDCSAALSKDPNFQRMVGEKYGLGRVDPKQHQSLCHLETSTSD